MANLPPKEPQTQLEPEGGRMTMIIMMMMMIMMMIMMTIMTMTNIMCFLDPKGPQTGLVPGVGPIKYDDDDDFDDNDDNDDDDDGDSYGNDLFNFFV